MNDSRFIFFFFNDTATTEIYTLSLHDALPICDARFVHQWLEGVGGRRVAFRPQVGASLGARLVTAFAGEFAGGARRVVIIGSDCPGVDRRLVRAAFAALGRRDAVLGPARGGGYFLIGLAAPPPAVFPRGARAPPPVAVGRRGPGPGPWAP